MKDRNVVTNIPRLELLAGVTAGAAGDKERGDVGVATLSHETSSRLSTTPASLLPKADVEEGEGTLASRAVGPAEVSVPVALAQPMFFNSQVLSGLYRSPASAHLAASLQSPHLGAILIPGSQLMLPEIPFSSLLSPSMPRCMPLALTSLVTAPGRASSVLQGADSDHCSPCTPNMFARSPSRSFDKGVLDGSANSDRDRGKDVGVITDFGDHKPSELRDSKPLKRASSAESAICERRLRRSPTAEGKDMALVPAVPLKIPLYLCGHSFPSLHAATFMTFCSAKRPQPNYVQVKGNNRRVSMYSNWRLATHNPNPVGLTSRMLLALYR